ncbi:NADH dehydrogenase [ubiquinone] 1 subunit C2 [Bombyx mandarina]|uniref:NADH dehydrogenase [ubiquinone] 1 subunit C2 n=2 Tax=Bombyx TaxID=7090 RepID=A0A8R2M092_BOMMO|nr:NADH dehydrogenase [ubiquinone] 1 subunit C2 [Bombyx mandarina]XP_037870283.1 NADH dehydrogenase [ubiquinone] 1 subunit C2 [Bombyx mori]
MSLHMSAQELLKLGDEGRQKPFLNKYWPEIIGVTFGIGTGMFLNFQTKRPVFSGIQKHIIATGGWVSILSYVQHKRNEYLAEKDAVYRHYIELHPDDFPVPERKKIGDLFEPWIPVR